MGEKVFLKLQPYAQSSVANRNFCKLSYKFFGLLEILSKIGTSTYKLQLPAECLIHLVFHVSQLKEHLPEYIPVFSSLRVVQDLSIVDTIPIDRRLVKKGNVAHLQVLIKWTHLDNTFTTWEDYEVLCKRFPHASAWGQAGSDGGGTVTTVLAALGMEAGKKKRKK